MFVKGLRLLAIGAAVGCLMQPSLALSKDLRIGFDLPTNSMDPHYHTGPKNNMVNSHIFEALVKRDDKGVPQPQLAESWSLVDPTTWEFKLRENVRFHDGTPFTTDDVIFSYERAPNVPNALLSFKTYTKSIERLEKVDDHTLRIHTKGEAPGLPLDLSFILIISKKNGEAATTADYNTGAATIGTGPYKFVSFSPAESTVVERNDDYWGKKEPWDKVIFKMMPVAASRVAALLSNDVDLIESVPPNDLDRLEKNSDVSVIKTATSRIIYYTFDVTDEPLKGTHMSDIDGNPLTTNPLSDPKVREALKLAISTAQMKQSILQGLAQINGQYVPEGYLGYNEAIEPWVADAAKARQLLEESGWGPNKFKMVLSTWNAAFPNSDAAVEAIAQSWTQIGIPTSVFRAPYPAWEALRQQRKLGPLMVYYSNPSSEADVMYTSVLHSREGNFGALNPTRDSNAEVDKLIEASVAMMDRAARAKTLAEASRIAVSDNIVVPLWMTVDLMAARSDITYHARPDRYIFAMDATPN